MSDDPTLDKLKKKIQEAQKKGNHDLSQRNTPQTLGGKFFNVGAELVAGVFVGVGFGLFVDWAMGTSPGGLILFFILGSIAGMLNVYRALTVKKPINKEKDTHV